MAPGQAKDILDKLLHDLYEVPIRVVYDNIAKVVYDNIELTLNIVDESAVRYVRFNGEVYFSTNLTSYKDRQSVVFDSTLPNRSMVMHDATKAGLLPEIAELKSLNDEQKECAYYLRILLNKCKSLHDVQALLPDAAWRTLKIKIGDFDELNISEEDILETNKRYAEEAATIKERIFLNLLLKKV